MESSSNVHEVQQGWKQFITPAVEARKGQTQTWEAAMSERLMLVVLPTGYGKTLAAVGAYIVARGLRRARRMLVLVPTDVQRTQWVDKAKDNFTKLGAKLGGVYSIEKSEHELKAVQSGSGEVFVATYQQTLSDDGYWKHMMSSGDWFIVYDECHHLSGAGRWGECSRFDSNSSLYLSATPVRTDNSLLVGIPYDKLNGGVFQYRPAVEISYADAVLEEAVRMVAVHRYQYFIDVDTSEGTRRLTAESLKEVTNLSDYETKYQIRYHQKYLSTILLGAAALLNERNLKHPVGPGRVDHHQMLVFAMSCMHAESVSRSFNGITEAGFSDWIGVARSDADNNRVLQAYLDGKLRCLVQVDKAGEGFDNVRSSVLVFLNLIRSSTKIAQQLGRGLRRNRDIPFVEDLCAAFASADSPSLDYLTDMEKESEGQKENSKRPFWECLWGDEKETFCSLPDLSVLDVELDRVDIIVSGAIVDTQKASRGAEILRSWGVPGIEAMPADVLQRVAEGYSGARADVKPEVPEFKSENSKRDYWRDKVTKAVRVIASNAIAKMGRQSTERTLQGDIIKSAHRQWIKETRLDTDSMNADQLRQKYDWLARLNKSIEEAGPPSWLVP